MDQLNYLISQSDNPANSLKKIKDTLIVDIEKIITAYNLPEKNDAD